MGDEGVPVEERVPKGNVTVRFEWTLAWQTGGTKSHTDVRSDNAKERKNIPLPPEWTRITATRIQKACERSQGDLMIHWPHEFQAERPTVRCESVS